MLSAAASVVASELPFVVASVVMLVDELFDEPEAVVAVFEEAVVCALVDMYVY